MKYLILVDKKPEKCDKCFFYTQDLIPVEGNTYDLRLKCAFDCNVETCPLTVMNTIFSTDEEGEN